MKTPIGSHITWDIYNANKDTIAFVPNVRHVLNTIVSELGLTIVSQSYKQFKPFGATGFILLEESHVSIHTWPEHQFAAVDIFSCQPFNQKRIEVLLMSSFQSNKVISKTIERGEYVSIASSSDIIPNKP